MSEKTETVLYILLLIGLIAVMLVLAWFLRVPMALSSEATNWYFAEGCTREGFDTYYCISNPNDTPADVQFNFMLETGEIIRNNEEVEAHSRSTFALNSYVPVGQDVAARITTDEGVIVERVVSFDYHDKWQGVSTVVGANQLQTTFLFAEGTTRDGFEEWLVLQNPNNDIATVNVAYMLGDVTTINGSYQVGAHSRKTVDVNGEVGSNKDVSMRVNSSLPIMAERPMYFDYQGRIQGGTTVIGVPEPATEWHFAEGTTRNGFDEYLCLLNPSGELATVRIDYAFADGSVMEKCYAISPKTRYTVTVRNEVGNNEDVSATVTSDVPVVAERPMYFDYEGNVGGTDVFGSLGLAREFFVPEMATTFGFDCYLSCYNPSGTKGTMEVLFKFDDGSVEAKNYTVSPMSRFTLTFQDEVGQGKNVTCEIETNFPAAIERVVYGGGDGYCLPAYEVTK